MARALATGYSPAIGELVVSIETYLAQRDLDQKRYVWKAEGQEILNKFKRVYEAFSMASEKN